MVGYTSTLTSHTILHPHILHLTSPPSHTLTSSLTYILCLHILTHSTLTFHSSPLPPTQPILGVHSQKVLEEAKYYMQEQLLRKAAQKEALAAMDQEQQR